MATIIPPKTKKKTPAKPKAKPKAPAKVFNKSDFKKIPPKELESLGYKAKSERFRINSTGEIVSKSFYQKALGLGTYAKPTAKNAAKQHRTPYSKLLLNEIGTLRKLGFTPADYDNGLITKPELHKAEKGFKKKDTLKRFNKPPKAGFFRNFQSSPKFKTIEAATDYLFSNVPKAKQDKASFAFIVRGVLAADNQERSGEDTGENPKAFRMVPIGNLLKMKDTDPAKITSYTMVTESLGLFDTGSIDTVQVMFKFEA